MRTSLPNLASVTLRVKTNAKGRAYVVASGDHRVSRIAYGAALVILTITGCMYQSMEPVVTPAVSLRAYQDNVERQYAIDLKIERQQEQLLAKQQREKEQILAERREKEQATIVAYYSTNNRAVSKVAIKQIVRHSAEASKKFNVPQTLILAVIETESGLNPFARSTANAEGLMQIIPHYHQANINAYGGTENLVDPKSNILMGTAVLKEYLVKYNFNTEKALLQYNGSLEDSSKSYSNKVLTRKSRVDQYISSRVAKA